MNQDLISRQAILKHIEKKRQDALMIDDLRESNIIMMGMKLLEEAVRNQPSAQPEQRKGTMLLNLNDNIKVKLTDLGKDIYYHQYDRTNKFVGKEICKPSFPKEDENGYTEFQLWCFMELYGPHMGMTLPNVIQPLDLIIEPERIIEHFEQMPSAQPEQQWIPIEEQCPEPNEMVLISINGEVDADWIAVDLTGYGCWYRAMKDVMSVDAWKPLPKPYAERKEDASSR